MSKQGYCGYLRQDDDEHWYLIPEELIENFDSLWDKMTINNLDKLDELNDLFDECYGAYRLRGGYRDLLVVVPLED